MTVSYFSVTRHESDGRALKPLEGLSVFSGICYLTRKEYLKFWHPVPGIWRLKKIAAQFSFFVKSKKFSNMKGNFKFLLYIYNVLYSFPEIPLGS